MSGLARRKGRKGETAAKNLLADKDWTILADLTSGISTEDLIVEDTSGTIYSVEVKNVKLIDVPKFRKQAMANAKKIKKRWLLMLKIDGTSSWLIMRQSEKPIVWTEKKEEL
jgi:Holliday junction resolvase-like predicted endonuclease